MDAQILNEARVRLPVFANSPRRIVKMTDARVKQLAA